MSGTLVEQGREAASRGDWHQAHDLLVRATAGESTRSADLLLAADVAYAAGHLDAAIDVLERLHADSLRRGDRLAAATAATRVAMHLLFDTALIAPVRGWAKRAELLLEGHEVTAVHAWLAVVRNYERLLSGDFAEARRWARRAIEVGTQHDPAAAAIGRIAEARNLILDGDVRHGLDLLDEAAVATVSGELDSFLTGVVYCELVCALQALAQYDLAEQWTQAMERWRHGRAVGSIHGRCRVHRAEILRLRGSNDDAEQEALLACEELRPYLRRELGWPLTELGRIRLRKGDVDGAEKAFVAAHEAGWDAQPGLALVHLARGEIALAVTSIREALDHPLRIPSKELPPNTELRRAPLLEAQVEIAIAADDLERAQWAGHELEEIARLFESKALTAGATLARARIRLAEGDAAGARSEFDAALHLWNEIGAPYESALARMGLAQAHRIGGNEERAILEFRTAGAALERVGAAYLADEAANACADVRTDHTLVPESAPQSGLPVDEWRVTSRGDPQVNVFRRESDAWRLTFDGHTAHLRDVKGLRYLTRLLADPGHAVHVLDLVAFERGESSVGDDGTSSGEGLALGDAGEMLDARAKAAYRRRLAEIDDDIDDARVTGDVEREAQADAEREFLTRELSRAIGLGGRDRRAGSATERARAGVTQAIRAALRRIGEHHPALGVHLDRTIRTGVYCTYVPDPRIPVNWLV